MQECRKEAMPEGGASENVVRTLLQELYHLHRLELSSYEYLLRERTEADEELARQLARECTEKYYGRGVYTRGLIEFTN